MEPLFADNFISSNPSDNILCEELNACCNSLGKIDINDGTYMKDRDCKPCLREIARYLGADKGKHTARCQLNELNIVNSDLVPLLVQYCDFNDGDPELFNLILRICTSLTTPTQLLFENKQVPCAQKDREQRSVYDKIHKQLSKYKETFASNEYVWSTLNVYLSHNTEDDVQFERLIVLIRNILHIPIEPPDDTMKLGTDIHETLLKNMHKSGLLSTMLKLLSESSRASEYCFHLMEIIYYMLRDQNPRIIARAQKPHKITRTKPYNDEQKLRYKEIRARNALEIQANNQMAKFCRFKQSAFVIESIRGIGNRPLIFGQPIVDPKSVLNDSKTLVRKSKNRKPLDHKTSMEICDQKNVSSQTSYDLKVFCKHFMDKVYNTSMLQMKHNLIQKRAQEDDEATYLWALQFFTSFNRNLKLPIENITESLAISTFHYINVLITSYQERIQMEKKNFHTLTGRLHLSLRAYREILLLLESIGADSSYSSKVESLMKAIFAEKDYANLLFLLFKHYCEPKHTLHYARDLIDTNHIFIRLYEEYCQTKSLDMSVTPLMGSYAHPDIIQIYISILKQYRQNEQSINTHILSFFERLISCKYDLMLCQASIFSLLFEMAEDALRPAGQDKSRQLLKHLCEFFGNLFNKRSWMFQELLFWKTPGDVVSIETEINPPPELEVLVEPDEDEAIGAAMAEERNMEIPLSQLLADDDDDDQRDSILDGVDNVDEAKDESNGAGLDDQLDSILDHSDDDYGDDDADEIHLTPRIRDKVISDDDDDGPDNVDGESEKDKNDVM